jgi:hypothetical protein
MPEYEWVNEKGESQITNSFDAPPKEPGEWKRVFAFGVSTVSGAGGSPSRVSLSGIPEPKPSSGSAEKSKPNTNHEITK